MSDSVEGELVVPVGPDDHVLGPVDAAVTLVDSGDFECPNRAQAFPTVKLLVQTHADRVRFVFRHFPLVEVHPSAMRAAVAAQCAADGVRFWPMHDQLFHAFPKLAAQALIGHAAAADLAPAC